MSHLAMIDLHLDDDRNVPEPAEHLAQCRNTHAARPKGMAPGRIDPAVPGIDPRELGRGATIDGARGIRGAVERRVVAHDDHPVGGEMHVQLQPVGTGREATLERGHGVLRAERAAASMCKHAGTRRAFEEGHDGQ